MGGSVMTHISFIGATPVTVGKGPVTLGFSNTGHAAILTFAIPIGLLAMLVLWGFFSRRPAHQMVSLTKTKAGNVDADAGGEQPTSDANGAPIDRTVIQTSEAYVSAHTPVGYGNLPVENHPSSDANGEPIGSAHVEGGDGGVERAGGSSKSPVS